MNNARQAFKVIESLTPTIALILVSIFIFYFRKSLIRFFISMNFLLASLLISFIASVSLFPIPYTYILFIIASIYHLNISYIMLLAVVSGLGSALGEAVAWIMGKIGGEVLKSTQYFKRIHALLELTNALGFKILALLVFLFSFTPLPDKVLYLPLGMMGYSLWKILPITIIGKITMTFSVLIAGRVIGEVFKELTIENELLVFIAMTLLLIIVMVLTMFIEWDRILMRFFHQAKTEK